MASDILITGYVSRIELLAAKFFPFGSFVVNSLRYNRVNIRIVIGKNIFVGLYFNPINDRRGYSLIKNGKRIIGWDNFGGWHHHPSASPEKHIRCREPKEEYIFEQIQKLIERISCSF